jgi:hypothetical protein
VQWANPADAALLFGWEMVDFGGVLEGAAVPAQFEFANIGSDTLEIEIVSACDCMRVEWTPGPVPPGQKGQVSLVFDSKGRPGPVEKDIDVIFKNTDADGYPLVKRLLLKGLVLTPK